MMTTNERLEFVSRKFIFPDWAKPLFKPYRFKVIYGGRGSGKSFTVADFLLMQSMLKGGIILCGREYQESLKESVYTLLKDRIEHWGLEKEFKILRDEIRCNITGTRFIFVGLRHNIGSIKSIPNIIYAWIEEGAYITYESWIILVPTVRAANSEIIVTFNPLNRTDIIYREFVESEPPANAWIKKITYRDNPYFTEPLVSDREDDFKRATTGEYNHKWEGEVLEHSDAQIFKGYWTVAEFEEPKNIHPYYGLDFGFSPQHPTAGIRCYIDKNILYITHEAVKSELDLDDTGKFLEERLPRLKENTIYADCAEPKSINFLKARGYRIEPVKKGKDSIEGGIKHIKSFDKIIINPSCIETIKEFTLYSYKVDERSGDITDNIVDKHNHCIDGLRYALERCTRRTRPRYGDIKVENWT